MPQLDFTNLPAVKYTTETFEVKEGDTTFCFTFSFPPTWEGLDQSAMLDKAAELTALHTGKSATPILVGGSRITVSPSLCNVVATFMVSEEASGCLDLTSAEDWFTLARRAPTAWSDLMRQYKAKRKELYPINQDDGAESGSGGQEAAKKNG